MKSGASIRFLDAHDCCRLTNEYCESINASDCRTCNRPLLYLSKAQNVIDHDMEREKFELRYE